MKEIPVRKSCCCCSGWERRWAPQRREEGIIRLSEAQNQRDLALSNDASIKSSQRTVPARNCNLKRGGKNITCVYTYINILRTTLEKERRRVINDERRRWEDLLRNVEKGFWCMRTRRLFQICSETKGVYVEGKTEGWPLERRARGSSVEERNLWSIVTETMFVLFSPPQSKYYTMKNKVQRSSGKTYSVVRAAL